MHLPPDTQRAGSIHRLTRTVRLNVLQAQPQSDAVPRKGVNGEGGKPAMDGFGAHYEFEVRCEGEPNAKTGYLINIKQIDTAVREGVVPLIVSASADGRSPISLMPRLLAETSDRLPVGVASIALRLTPSLILEFFAAGSHRDSKETEMAEVIVRQMLEFSAAHRLHVPGLSDQENEALFGKCNNPAGHGHNYRIEPAVAVDPERPMTVDAIERITDEVVIERFDHKHLNDQTEEFSAEGGLNPSVENIARVCYGLLDRPIADAGGRLKAVTVWETDRTSCTYPG